MGTKGLTKKKNTNPAGDLRILRGTLWVSTTTIFGVGCSSDFWHITFVYIFQSVEVRNIANYEFPTRFIPKNDQQLLHTAK